MAWFALLLLISLFVALHVVTLLPALRGRLTAVLGEPGYKGAYTLASLVGLFGAFVAAGAVSPVILWTAPEAPRWLALALTLAAFVLVGAAYVGGAGARFARHPMLAGIALWAAAHLLTNGDAGHVVVFGALLGYALAAMPLSDRRDALRDPAAFAERRARTSLVPFTRLAGGPFPWRGPAAGVVGWLAFLGLHPWLFGVSALP